MNLPGPKGWHEPRANPNVGIKAFQDRALTIARTLVQKPSGMERVSDETKQQAMACELLTFPLEGGVDGNIRSTALLEKGTQSSLDQTAGLAQTRSLCPKDITRLAQALLTVVLLTL